MAQVNCNPWLRNHMEALSALLALCERNPSVTDGFPSQRAVMWTFDVSFYVSLNKLLDKQSRGLVIWDATTVMWRHCDADFDVGSLQIGIDPTSHTWRPRRACYSWWRHQMEIISALLALCVGNSPVPGEFPSQRSVTRSFDVFFHLRVHG